VEAREAIRLSDVPLLASVARLVRRENLEAMREHNARHTATDIEAAILSESSSFGVASVKPLPGGASRNSRESVELSVTVSLIGQAWYQAGRSQA